MRILLFDFIRHFGGASQLALDLTKRLAKDNQIEVIDVYGSCSPYMEGLARADIPVHVLLPNAKEVYIGYKNKKLQRLWRLFCQLPSFLLLRNRLIRKVLEIDPDVIWTTGDIGLLFVGSSPRLRKYPLLRYVGSCLDAPQISAWGRFVMKRFATILMAISTETSKQLQIAGISGEKITIVFDTIDMADTLNRSVGPLEVALPGMDKYPKIVLAASLCHAKGQHAAIKTVAKLKSDGFDPALWLAGDKFGNDQSYVQYLHDLIEQLELSENIHLLGWRHDVPTIMNQCDFVVVPSHTEGFGHTVLEGMFLRRPVIATPVGGICDSIQDGINGLNFPIDDHKMMAKQIERLCNDKVFADKIVENAYKTVTERFSQDIHTKSITAALEEAIKRKTSNKK